MVKIIILTYTVAIEKIFMQNIKIENEKFDL